MIAEYAAAYGGPPARDCPWPLFLALVMRIGRFDARRVIVATKGASLALATAFSGGLEASMEVTRMERVAFPWRKKEPAFALVQSEAAREP